MLPHEVRYSSLPGQVAPAALPLARLFPDVLRDPLSHSRFFVAAAAASAAAAAAIAELAHEAAAADAAQAGGGGGVGGGGGAGGASAAAGALARQPRKRKKKNLTPLQRWSWMAAQFDWLDTSERRRAEWLAARTVWCTYCGEAKNGSKNFSNIARHELTEKHRANVPAALGGGR
jgi:hypothetical protein